MSDEEKPMSVFDLIVNRQLRYNPKHHEGPYPAEEELSKWCVRVAFFNHPLKDFFIRKMRTSVNNGFSFVEAWRHADDYIVCEFSVSDWEDFHFKLHQFYVSESKIKKPENPKPFNSSFQLITLTLPNDLPHDEGRKYLNDYISKYFLGQNPKNLKKTPKPIECAWCIEIGESNNLHAHIFTFHPNYKLSTNNAPLKAYKYNANVKTAETKEAAINFYNYVLKPGGIENHPNLELRRKI